MEATIFIDDLRPYSASVEEHGDSIVAIVRNGEQFKQVVTAFTSAGIEITSLKFDNDLGLKSEMGFELLSWIINESLDGKVNLSRCEASFHSANTPARISMQEKWKSFKIRTQLA